MTHKPAPFKRPSIEIGVRVTRRWVDTEAGNLSVGDIVQDRGLVDVLIPVFPSSSGAVKIVYASGLVEYPTRTVVVRAFTEGAPVGHSE